MKAQEFCVLADFFSQPAWTGLLAIRDQSRLLLIIFHEFHELLEACGIQLKDLSGAHTKAVNILRESKIEDVKALGLVFDNLRKLRCDADYQIHKDAIRSMKDVDAHVQSAKQAINRVREFKTIEAIRLDINAVCKAQANRRVLSIIDLRK